MSILDLTAGTGKKDKGRRNHFFAGHRSSDKADQSSGRAGSFLCYVRRRRSMKRAKEVQAQIEAGTLTGPLAGVPAAIKDNMCTKDMRTTCSSKILENFVPTYTAEAVLNLEKAGAVILGKTNMDEFAMGSTTETSYYGVTRNPWNTEHVLVVLQAAPVQL